MEKSANRIVSTPGTRGGRPRIEGTRIAVSDVLGWVESGMSEEEILDDFPSLTAEDIQAAREYRPTT